MIIVNDNKKYDIELKELVDMLFAKKIEVKVIDREQFLELGDISNDDVIRLEKVEDKVKICLRKSDVLYEDEMEINSYTKNFSTKPYAKITKISLQSGAY